VDLTFRPAAAGDIADLADLIQSAYRGDESRRGWTTEADLLAGQRTDAAELAEVIGGVERGILLAEREGALVGCCRLERRPCGAAYLGMLSVRPGLQDGGIGRAIVGEAERAVRCAWGARRMQMTVIRQRHELIAWYERLGYRRTGATEPFPYDDVRSGIPKVAGLEFVVLEKPLA
jgi:ribosomal protein S18 acetylase RimI-like enzyme